MQESEIPAQLPSFAAFGQRKVRPRACIIDRKQLIRTFLRDAFEKLEFISCACANHIELQETLKPHLPDIVLTGLLAGREEGQKF